MLSSNPIFFRRQGFHFTSKHQKDYNNHDMSKQHDSTIEARFRDITWMMGLIDVEAILSEIKPLTPYSHLESLVSNNDGDEIKGYCPDHDVVCGRVSSDPNWWVNLHTGRTLCFSEGRRGSNLLFVIARILKGSMGLTTEDMEKAEKFMLKKDYPEAEILLLRSKAAQTKLENYKKQVKKEYQFVDEVKKGIMNRVVTKRLLDFFMCPPNKKPTNIRKETVDHYNVYEKNGGRYANRAIIPILFKGEYRGFSAIDLLGKEEWLKQHPTMEACEYKKTIFPSKDSGFYSKQWLFGFDDCQKKCDCLIVCEGPREVMKLWQEGFTNAVACFGTSLSDEQLLHITELSPKKVIVLFDGDVAGRESSDKAKKFLESFFKVGVVELEEGVDPKQLDREQLLAVFSGLI